MSKTQAEKPAERMRRNPRADEAADRGCRPLRSRRILRQVSPAEHQAQKLAKSWTTLAAHILTQG